MRYAVRGVLVAALMALCGSGWAQGIHFGKASGGTATENTWSQPQTFSGGQDIATLGTELVTNGTFTPDLTGWAGAGWSAAGGGALHTAGDTTAMTQSITVSNASKYVVGFTISGVSAGTVTVSVGTVTVSNAGTTSAFDLAGTYNRAVTAAATGAVTLSFTPTTTFNGTIDNVSVKIVTANDDPVLDVVDSEGASMAPIRGRVSMYLFAQGYNALRWNATGTYNYASGIGVLANNITGVSNQAAGYVALASNVTGSFNTAFGDAALQANTIGDSNSAFGLRSLAVNTSGMRNSAFGDHALFTQTTQSDNVGFGFQAGYTSTCAGCVFIGSLSGKKSTTGAEIVAVGTATSYNSTTATKWTGVGYYALYNQTTGAEYNTAFGNTAGRESGASPSTANAVTTGTKLTFVGARSGLGSATQRTNSGCFGFECYVDADNSYAIGDENITNVSIGSAAQATVSSKGFVMTAVLFAALGTPADGTIYYCSDCTVASPCAGSGTGALAKRLAGAWVCN